MLSAKEYKKDIILVLIVLLIGAGLAVVYLSGAQKGTMVEVCVDEGLVKRLPLKRNCEYRIESAYGYNLVQIKDGKASIIDADCPDKLCVKMGNISRSGQSVVCLPHRTTVKIVGDFEERNINKDTGVDIIAR